MLLKNLLHTIVLNSTKTCDILLTIEWGWPLAGSPQGGDVLKPSSSGREVPEWEIRRTSEWPHRTTPKWGRKSENCHLGYGGKGRCF